MYIKNPIEWLKTTNQTYSFNLTNTVSPEVFCTLTNKSFFVAAVLFDLQF